MRRGRQPPHAKRPPDSRRRSAPEVERRGRGPKRRGREPERQDLLTGVISIEADGSARLIPDPPGVPHVHIPPEDVGGFEDGEAVTVRLEVGRKGRVRGRIVARGLRPSDVVVGVVHASGGLLMLLPEPEGPPFAIAPADLAGAREGDAVTARVLDYGERARIGRAAVDEVLGRPGEPPVQVEMLVRSLGLPIAFPEAALAEADTSPPVIPAAVLRDEPFRRDLRDVPQVTIDSADARDFDDAVGARAEAGGIRVWISIADVSHYVRPRSALDDSARERGTSVYFPHRAIPMLPERLSNGLCSLVPYEPRLTLTCELRVRPNGRTEDVHIYPSLIQSAGRLTYDQVQAAIEGKGGPAAEHAMLPDLVGASRALRARRRQRGAVDLDLPEAQVILGPDGVAAHVRERGRVEAHRVIEDLMIAANEAVAEHLLGRRWPTVYRIHEPPDRLRVMALAEWAATLGVHVDVEGARKPRALARVADALQKRPQGASGVMLLLRSMAQARYSPENVGHYGLASSAYAHFTSPIRRYPDLLVHRSLRALWQRERPLHGLDTEAERASLRERRAVAAERQVAQLMACHVAERHLGEVFEASVTGVHAVGAFVRVREPWLEGLLPREALGSDYYAVVAREQALVGRRSGHRIALGDVLTVRLLSVSTHRRQMQFELVGRPAARAPRPLRRHEEPARAERARAERERRTRARPGREPARRTKKKPGRPRR